MVHHLHRRRGSGFSLLEVLLAVALFVIASTAFASVIMSGLSGIAWAQSRGDNSQDYRFVVQQVSRLASLDEVEDGGEFALVRGGVANWEAEVEETEIVDLFRVELKIGISENSSAFMNLDEVGKTEVLFLLRPAWSDPADRQSLLQDKTERLDDRRAKERRGF